MTDSTTNYSATAWAREHGEHFRYIAALDNHHPGPRNHAYGLCHQYSTETVIDAFILEGSSQFRDGNSAKYLLDDGRTVRAYYVAGYGGFNDEDRVILHPFPTNFEADGTQRTLSDGRTVDFNTWMVGPSRCYHLKISRAD